MTDAPVEDMTSRSALALAVLGALGCATEPGPDPGQPLFLAHRVPPRVSMEALFRGRVAADQAGCVRLDLPGESPTVVWPHRFTLRAEDDAAGHVGLSPRWLVVDEQGAWVGWLGDPFEISGGIVPTLPRHLVQNDRFEAAAKTRCPGPYWISGDVARPLSTR
jgi:hypothetical protein